MTSSVCIRTIIGDISSGGVVGFDFHHCRKWVDILAMQYQIHFREHSCEGLWPTLEVFMLAVCLCDLIPDKEFY